MSALQVAAAVVAVLLAAGAVWKRGRLGRERATLALLGAAALGIYASGVLGLLPDFEDLIDDVAGALGQWTYVLVGGLTFLETGAFVGLIVPGETTVIVGGVIAGQGEIEVVPLVGLVWLAAILGDSTSFWIGRRLGRRFLMRHGPRVKITEERLQQVERYFDRRGGATIVVGRFVGLIRALAPFIAGSSGMPYRRFLPYSVIGTGLWSTAFTMLGFVFYQSFKEVADIAGRATLGLGIVVGVTVAVVYAYRRRAQIIAWMEERPALRPLVRVLVPRLRFLRDRLTPGDLGIEFTTVVAIAVAGLYVFALYAIELGGGTVLTPGDSMALDMAVDLRNDTAVDAVKVLTDLGATPFVGGLVAAAAVMLAWRRRPVELVAVAGGFALLVLTVQAAKAGIDRGRPEGGLTVVEGQSYPSGHAAYATTYVALAVVASRVLPNLASRAALVGVALGVAAFVGISRVYLGVHFWSDVAGGWGVGFGIYAACGTLALLVAHIRNNERALAASSDHG